MTSCVSSRPDLRPLPGKCQGLKTCESGGGNLMAVQETSQKQERDTL